MNPEFADEGRDFAGTLRIIAPAVLLGTASRLLFGNSSISVRWLIPLAHSCSLIGESQSLRATLPFCRYNALHGTSEPVAGGASVRR